LKRTPSNPVFEEAARIRGKLAPVKEKDEISELREEQRLMKAINHW